MFFTTPNQYTTSAASSLLCRVSSTAKQSNWELEKYFKNIFRKHLTRQQRDVEPQCRKSIASFSLMETDNDRQICAQFLWYMPAFIFVFFNGSNNNNKNNNNGPSMQAGTVAGLKCILRIRRVHWRKLGFVLLYYFAFTYVCVNTQSRLTDWHSQFYWHNGNGWQWRRSPFLCARSFPVERRARKIN